VAAGNADVLVQRRVTVDRRFLRRHHAVAERVEARQRHRQGLPAAQLLRADLHRVNGRAHRVRDEPVQGLHEPRRLAALRIDRHRAAERDHGSNALRRLIGPVEREQPAEAPSDEAHLAAALEVHIADLLLERVRVLGAEADVAAKAPGLHVVAAVPEEELQREHRGLVGHEARKEQHRVTVAARRPEEHGQMPRERGHFQERARLRELVDEARFADVRMSRGHWSSSKRYPRRIGRPCEAASKHLAPWNGAR